MARVEIYTTAFCPFCIQAKSLLRNKGIDFHEIDVTGNPELRAKMTEQAGGRYTVPEIFINGEIIGGYDELRALEEDGELDGLLARQ